MPPLVEQKLLLKWGDLNPWADSTWSTDEGVDLNTEPSGPPMPGELAQVVEQVRDELSVYRYETQWMHGDVRPVPAPKGRGDLSLDTLRALLAALGIVASAGEGQSHGGPLCDARHAGRVVPRLPGRWARAPPERHPPAPRHGAARVGPGPAPEGGVQSLTPCMCGDDLGGPALTCRGSATLAPQRERPNQQEELARG
ncbi:hypothetical protein DRW03_33210 [Corallococcus sp. H22C18031201]|nr:hypothetical protein DRW03_33210 [Corallococcus sp. H22C18031201]